MLPLLLTLLATPIPQAYRTDALQQTLEIMESWDEFDQTNTITDYAMTMDVVLVVKVSQANSRGHLADRFLVFGCDNELGCVLNAVITEIDPLFEQRTAYD